MSDYPRLVHWQYNSGTGLFTNKNTKERLIKVFITDEKGESVLESGQVACLNSNGLFSNVQDPYFRLDVKEGFTSRARKHGKMNRDMREKYPELEGKLSSLNAKVAEYGDLIYLNIPHLDGYVNPLVKDNYRFHNNNFVFKPYFDKEFLQELINYRPQALMGGTISSYKEEILPELFSEIRIKFPELYKEVLEESQELQKMDKELTLVGKKAKVTTLSPGNVEVEITILDKDTFYWDGKELVNETETRCGETLTQRITPSEDTVVGILDDSVVNENTKLAE